MNNLSMSSVSRQKIAGRSALHTTKNVLAAVIATALMVSTASAASLQTTKATETASTGWATQSGGTTGGAKASSSKIYTVKSISEFKAALNGSDSSPKIIQVTGAIDISDGSVTDDKYTTKNGEKYVQHDGALDIKKGSDYITVSNSRFELHDKTILIGHSDSNGSQDAGKLRVTFHNNVFDHVGERTPRVRFGSVHAYNNVYIGDVNHKAYRYQYSFGIGTSGSLLSESNAFTIDNLTR